MFTTPNCSMTKGSHRSSGLKSARKVLGPGRGENVGPVSLYQKTLRFDLVFTLKSKIFNVPSIHLRKNKTRGNITPDLSDNG